MHRKAGGGGPDSWEKIMQMIALTLFFTLRAQGLGKSGSGPDNELSRPEAQLRGSAFS